MMHGARARSASASPTPTSPGAPPRGSSTEYLTELSRSRPTTAAQPLRQHPGHPAALPGTAGRRRSRSAPCSPPPCAVLGRLRRLRAVRARRRCGRAARSTWTRRSTSCAPRDWAAAERRPSLAPYLTRLNRLRRAHPALRPAAQPALPRRRQTTSSRYSKTRPATGDIVLVRRQPRPATHAGRRRCTLDMPAPAWTGRAASPCATSSPARPALGRAQPCGSTPPSRVPRTSSPLGSHAAT